MSTIELSSGSATLTARADYLLVVEHGTLATSDEVLRYVTELDTAGQRFHLRRLLVDARSESDESESGDARSAMWRWIRTQRTFDQIGFVLRDEMMIARVNMTALSERLPVRAFIAVADGHRWLARPRGSSTAIPAASLRPTASSVPPPPMAPRTPLPSRAPTPTPPHSAPPQSAPSQSARDSATRLARSTARLQAITAQHAESILESTKPTHDAGTGTRSTAKLPVVDERSAEDILRKPNR